MANIPVVLGLTGDFNAAATALPPFAQGRGFGTEREVSGERSETSPAGEIDDFAERASANMVTRLLGQLGVDGSAPGQSPSLSHGNRSGRFGFGGRCVGDAVSIADRLADRSRVVKGDDAEQTDGGIHRRSQQQADRE
jgi:hypothetical protein